MTKSELESTLLPCPFCGSKAELYHDSRSYDDLYYVECTECSAQAGHESIVWNAKVRYSNEEYWQRCIPEWNRRA